MTAQNGLFWNVLSGEIRNVHMVNVNINNPMRDIWNAPTGAVVGLHWDYEETHAAGHLTIRNSTVNGGTVQSQGAVGGIIGFGDHVTVTGCSVIANVSSAGTVVGGALDTGGIIGGNDTTTSSVSNSYFSGTVSATSPQSTQNTTDKWLSVGGIAGVSKGNITDCYVEGTIQITGTTPMWPFVGGIVGVVEATNRIIERNYIAASVTAATAPLTDASQAYASGVVGLGTNLIQTSTIIRNNAILSPSITVTSGAIRFSSEVATTASPSTITASNNHKINTLSVAAISHPFLTRVNASHSQSATFFQTQSSYTTAGNWTGGAWNFATNWIMSNNTTAGGVNRPLPQAYVNNVLNYQVKEPLFNPNDPQNIIRNLEGQIADLTDVSNQLAADLALERAALVIANNKLRDANNTIDELRDELKEFLDNPHVCPKPPEPEECECSPPAEPCVCECTDCDDMQELRDRIGELEIERAGHISTIASISATIEGMLEQDGSDGGTLEGLLAELQAMIAELQAKDVDTNPNTIDIWIFVSIGLGMVCLGMLVTMIIIGRRKVSVNITQQKVARKG
jgi:hypothetical protein